MEQSVGNKYPNHLIVMTADHCLIKGKGQGCIDSRCPFTLETFQRRQTTALERSNRHRCKIQSPLSEARFETLAFMEQSAVSQQEHRKIQEFAPSNANTSNQAKRQTLASLDCFEISSTEAIHSGIRIFQHQAAEAMLDRLEQNDSKAHYIGDGV